jgi:diacylglycerol O-acyltransferase
VREEGDLDSTNAVGFITADLATNIYDPEKRLRAIQESMRAGKALLKDLSSSEVALFMQLTQLPALMASILGLGARFPAFSTVISNVPGPRNPLYWNGARLDGIYPASIVFDGFAMNITLVSYHDNLDFGIVACRRSMPQIQRIIDHLEDSLQELEAVAGISAPSRRASDRTRRSSARGAKPAQTAARKKSAKKTAAGKGANRKAPAKGKASVTAKKSAGRKTVKATAAPRPRRKAGAAKARPKSAAGDEA